MPYVRQPVEFPVRYAYGPDSSPHAAVPRGELLERRWSTSRVFPATSRRYWIYLPADHDATHGSAALIVFLDGWLYVNPDGAFRAATVMDNLIARGEMPVTVGVFVDPGEPDRRNVEYDAFDSSYADFLITELIPAVNAEVPFGSDRERWAIAGGSAGANCAFTAAWHRPDRFSRVLCNLASFAQIEGGNPYVDLIPTTERKPLRIYLQAATRDLNFDQPKENWLSTSLRVAAALAERGYDLRLVLGDGDHSPASGNHGAATLPDALRWLWRG